MKLVIALLLSLIAISLCVPLAFGYEFGTTVEGATVFGGGAYTPWSVYNPFNLSVPAGYVAVFNRAYVYCANDSAGADGVYIGIYDANWRLVASTGLIPVASGLAWYSAAIECSLLEGTYYLAVGYGEHVAGRSTIIAGRESWYSSDFGFVSYPSTSAWDEKELSVYLTYDFDSIGGDPAIWAAVYTFGFIALWVVILVMFKLKIPILQFAVGALGLTVPIGLWAETNIIFTPFPQTVVLLTSITLVAYAAWSYRQTI